MEIIKDFKVIKKIIGTDILASPEYFYTLGSVDYGYFVENELILPFYLKKRYIFRELFLTKGILGISNNISENEFLKNVLQYVKKNMSVDFIRSHHTALFNYFPDDSIYCRFGSYILDLSQSEEALLSNIHSKHRNVIKKAKKDNVLISCGKENRDKCEFLINSTLSRQKVHQINQNMLNKLTALSNIDYWIAEYNDEIHGAAIIVWAENSAYYLYGGSIEKTHSGAMNLLHWAAIMEMKKRNVKFYDFVGARIDPEEGSKYEGIQRFKSRFGGELKQGYLWKLPLNKVKYKLYVSMQKLKNYGQFKGDIIDQERRRGMI